MRSISGEEELWGTETRKAVENFPVSGEPIPASVARWLGRIKAAAARVNADLGLLDREKADRIAAAGDRIASGEFDDQFPIDVFQTGSGTSSNMNANEVIAALAGEDVHANDDVNMGQSSNDVFPSAVHLAALDELVNGLLPALGQLAEALAAKAKEFDDVVKSGRTHLMDAVPVTLGQEFGGYAAQVRLGARRVRNALPQVAQVPLGGTATGTASIRCVRPDLTTSSNSRAFLSSEPASCSSAGIRSWVSWSSAARCTALGKTSLELCPMFTWSFGCAPSPARFAMTSLAFMFDDVPDPVWKTSIGN